MEDAPKFSGFEILETLPRGGMSTVYKARQISLERIVALKTLPPSLAHDPSDIEKFIFEARITASLKHPNIVQVYDFGRSEEGIYYFVMEFVSGYSVAHWIRRKQRVSQENALLIAQSVADALRYAWEREKIIHCDVKPDNIIIDSDGSVKVADLGLAKSIRSVADKSEDDVVFGTPNYIAPEQSRGDPNLDCRTDIYALGATIYHCITGKMPFEGQPPLEIMDRQITDTIADPQAIHPDISTGSACLVEKMMHKNPGDRQLDWSSVISDIVQVRSDKLPDGDFRQTKPSTVQRCTLRDQHLHDMYRMLDQKEDYRSDGLPERRYLQGFWLAGRSRAGGGTLLAAMRAWLIALPLEKVAAVALSLAVVVLTGLIVRHLRAPVSPPAIADKSPLTTSEHVSAPAETPLPPADTGQREKLAGELFDATLQWLTENPTRYDEAVGKFEEVATDARGTRYAALALEEVQKAQQAKKRAISRVMRSLREQAEQLGERNRFEDAAAVFSGYTGDMAEDTESQRVSIAAEWQARAEQYNAEQKAREEQFARRWRRMVAATAEAILTENHEPALAQISKSLNDKNFASRQRELRDLERLCLAASRLDQRLLASFQDQKGQTLEVRLARGVETLRISEVQGDVIMAEKVIPLGGGYAIQPHPLRLGDLSAREKHARLGSDGSPENALLRGVLAMREKNMSEAAGFFKSVGGELGELLYNSIDRQRRDQLEQTAAGEMLRLLSQVRINLPSPIPPVDECIEKLPDREFSAQEKQFLSRALDVFKSRYDDTEFFEQYTPMLDKLRELALRGEDLDGQVSQKAGVPPAVRLQEQMLNYNPGMLESEISSGTDQDGRVVRLHIVSGALRTLQPLAELTELRELVCGGGTEQNEADDIIPASLTDLAPLRDLPLRVLQVTHARVSDLTPLTGMHSLSQFSVAHTEVADIAPLAALRLAYLNLSHTAIRDFRPLRDMPLRRLNLNKTEFADIALLRGKSLESLSIANTRVWDITPITGMPLRRLDMSNTELRDLAALSGMPLEYLNLSGTKVRDLTQIHGMPLKHLDISGADIRNITPLRGMPLRFLDISRTGVRDLTPVQHAPIESIRLDYHPFQYRRDTDRGFAEVLRRMPALISVNDTPWRKGRDWSD